MQQFDVLVVGAGNAGLCAAIAASEGGHRVLVLERAPEAQRGGNSAFTGGAFRIRYDGVDDIKALVPDLTDEQIAESDFGTYSEDTYFDDLARLSHYRADSELLSLLVAESHPACMWMRNLGVRFAPIYSRQAFKMGGRFKFWGGLTVEVIGGGLGLVESLGKAAAARGVTVLCDARATSLLTDGAKVVGVRIARDGATEDIRAGAVVLAAGGFHANAQWRAAHLGKDWDLAKVRGSRFNTGDGIRMAIEAGAMPYGHWSGCHSVNYDANAPEFGQIDLLDQQKNSFWLGVMVNREGRRFIDEGADFRNYTYAQMGRWILQQPGASAWQVFDQKIVPLLTNEYRIRQISKVEADSLEGLAEKMDGIDKAGFLEEMRRYNGAVDAGTPFDPNVKDGKSTTGLSPNKSNWANRLDSPPYVAVEVTCGITFTYGGLRINTEAEVLTAEGAPIPGLYAAGEMVGGLFYHDYPGGAGLTAGTVFGRIAGRNAARASFVMNG